MATLQAAQLRRENTRGETEKEKVISEWLLCELHSLDEKPAEERQRRRKAEARKRQAANTGEERVLPESSWNEEAEARKRQAANTGEELSCQRVHGMRREQPTTIFKNIYIPHRLCGYSLVNINY